MLDSRLFYTLGKTIKVQKKNAIWHLHQWYGQTQEKKESSVHRLNSFKAPKFEYKSVPSAQTTVPHSELIPVPVRASLAGTAEEYVPVSIESVPESSMSL